MSLLPPVTGIFTSAGKRIEMANGPIPCPVLPPLSHLSPPLPLRLSAIHRPTQQSLRHVGVQV